MNNFEKIKAMSIDEMIDFILELQADEDCSCCPCYDWDCDHSNCDYILKQWLESEVENEHI